MLGSEELFCWVDDFCQTFEPQWKRQLEGLDSSFAIEREA